MVIFKVLHVLSMFAAATLLVSDALLYARAIWRGGSPWVQRLPRLAAEAIEAEAGQRPSEEVLAAMAEISTATLVAVGLNVLLFAAIITDMVLKPF